LAAGLAAARSGARTVIVEQDLLAGGSLLSDPVVSSTASWLAECLDELGKLPNAVLRTRTTAFGLYDGNTVALIERRDHLKPDPAKGGARQAITIMRAKAIVFATGAIERPLIFANNDRPGVMLASAVRTYLNRFAVAPGKRAVVVTNNNSAYRTALDLADNGLAVTIADLRATVAPEHQSQF